MKDGKFQKGDKVRYDPYWSNDNDLPNPFAQATVVNDQQGDYVILQTHEGEKLVFAKTVILREKQVIKPIKK